MAARRVRGRTPLWKLLAAAFAGFVVGIGFREVPEVTAVLVVIGGLVWAAHEAGRELAPASANDWLHCGWCDALLYGDGTPPPSCPECGQPLGE